MSCPIANIQKGLNMISKVIDVDPPSPLNAYLGCGHSAIDVPAKNIQLLTTVSSCPSLQHCGVGTGQLLRESRYKDTVQDDRFCRSVHRMVLKLGRSDGFVFEEDSVPRP